MKKIFFTLTLLVSTFLLLTLGNSCKKKESPQPSSSNSNSCNTGTMANFTSVGVFFFPFTSSNGTQYALEFFDNDLTFIGNMSVPKGINVSVDIKNIGTSTCPDSSTSNNPVPYVKGNGYVITWSDGHICKFIATDLNTSSGVTTVTINYIFQ